MGLQNLKNCRRRHLSKPHGAVGIAEVEAAQFLLDPLEIDVQPHASVQTAEFPDAVREVNALLPHPGLREPPVCY